MLATDHEKNHNRGGLPGATARFSRIYGWSQAWAMKFNEKNSKILDMGKCTNRPSPTYRWETSRVITFLGHLWVSFMTCLSCYLGGHVVHKCVLTKGLRRKGEWPGMVMEYVVVTQRSVNKVMGGEAGGI